MSPRTGRLLLLGCLSATLHADSFTLQVTSTNASLGSLPAGPLAGSTGGEQTLDLTPNVQASYNFQNYTNFFYPGGGPPHTGATATVVQTVTVNGVSVNVTRTLTLVAAPSPGHDCANTVLSPAVTVTVDLGASGKVDVTLPFVGFAGEDCNNNTVISRGIVVIPGTTGAILLHDVPPVCQPPTVTPPTASPNVLWPPNHKMAPVSVSASTSGGCGAVACKIVSVSSSEPPSSDAVASGDAVITGKLTLDLRAERNGSRLGNTNGRVYTIIVQCTDASNNSTTKTVKVLVPHDQGN